MLGLSLQEVRFVDVDDEAITALNQELALHGQAGSPLVPGSAQGCTHASQARAGLHLDLCPQLVSHVHCGTRLQSCNTVKG